MRIVAISLALVGMISLALGAVSVNAWAVDAPTIVDEHANLKEYLFIDPPSHFSMGIGLVPLGVAGSRFMAALDVFQLNWQTSWFDWQLINATVGVSFGQNTGSNAKYFMTMTEPKIRLSRFLSLGVMGGAEFVTFPNVQAQLQNTNAAGTTFTTPIDSFSTSSLIYGLCAAEYFDLSESTKIKVTEVAFRENYSVSQSNTGWTYNYSATSSSFDTSTVAPSTVFLVEISLIY